MELWLLIILIIISITNIVWFITWYKGRSCDLRTQLRELFTDHAVYTEFVITDILSSAPTAKTTSDTNRLLLNQQDIGNFIGKKVASNIIGQQLATLLTQHIQDAAACITDLKAGNVTQLKEDEQKLFINSDQVGAFLSSLNPTKLPLVATQAEFHQHNQYVLDLATAQYSGNYNLAVQTFDAYYAHMMHFSDLLYSAL